MSYLHYRHNPLNLLPCKRGMLCEHQRNKIIKVLDAGGRKRKARFYTSSLLCTCTEGYKSVVYAAVDQFEFPQLIPRRPRGAQAGYVVLDNCQHIKLTRCHYFPHPSLMHLMPSTRKQGGTTSQEDLSFLTGGILSVPGP